jgi:hypothetical protein
MLIMICLQLCCSSHGWDFKFKDLVSLKKASWGVAGGMIADRKGGSFGHTSRRCDGSQR